MEKNTENPNGQLEKLALICDATQKLFPNGKQGIIFELDEDEYKNVQSNFRAIDGRFKRFQIDVSGVECVFINRSIYDEVVEDFKTEDPVQATVDEKKPTFLSRLRSIFLK